MEMPNCSGNCGDCRGCARELVLTEQEICFLKKMGQIPFLPIARSMGDLTPVYLEEGAGKQQEYALLLQCLEKKGLVSLDYDMPIRGVNMEAYSAYPIQGSMALTQRGQQILELLEYQGANPE